MREKQKKTQGAPATTRRARKVRLVNSILVLRKAGLADLLREARTADSAAGVAEKVTIKNIYSGYLGLHKLQGPATTRPAISSPTETPVKYG